VIGRIKGKGKKAGKVKGQKTGREGRVRE